MEAILSTLVQKCINRRFDEVEISPRQERYWKKGIVPWAVLWWLSDHGCPDIVEDFKNVNRAYRKVPFVAAYMENRRADIEKYRSVFENTVGKLLGGLRYRDSDSRPSPQTTLVKHIDLTR